MPTRNVTAVFMTLLAMGLCLRAHADTVTLGASKDNTLYYNETGQLSNGKGPDMIAGRTLQGAPVDARRALIAFDLSSIPAGSTVTGVTLQLYMVQTRAGNVRMDLFRTSASWGEGTSDATNPGSGDLATPGDATWIHRFFPDVLWTNPGGDFARYASASTTVGAVGTYSWSGPGLVADVQAWLDGSVENDGWTIVADETIAPGAKRFYTHEGPSETTRPHLTVTYTPPASYGACCLGNSCIQASPDACNARGGTYQGNSSPCSSAPCTQPTGACCVPGSGCMPMTMADCATSGGSYHGDGSACAPGQCSAALTPFVDALPIPQVAQPVSGTVGGAAAYTIGITRFQQQLHRDLPPTTVWGYNGTYPGPTIEAGRDLPVSVSWINNLRASLNGTGPYLQHHDLPIDPCLHGPSMYGDLPRTVVHLHGAHVPADSDGFPDVAIAPGGTQTFTYPNHQAGATLWYHDHALGITADNVYMGLAGFYILREPSEQSLGLPQGAYEIPLVIQDRTFNTDGSLQYPTTWTEHVFGDTVLVNGKVWPYLSVAQCKYRFRILNGSNGRFYTLSLSDGTDFQQIGSDTGLLSAPLTLTQLTLAPAERADCVFDFTGYPAGTEIVLTNSAPAPFPGPAGVGVVPNVMKFVVTSSSGAPSNVPPLLDPVVPIPESQASLHRTLIIKREASSCTGTRFMINGQEWSDITEYPRLGDTEVWSFINRSNQTHPMHIHLVRYQVLDRQAFVVGNDGSTIVPTGPVMPPDPNEQGWKDTVRCPPSQITRVIMTFEDYSGVYPYHCHMLEHEDNEMMRQMQVIPGCGSADFNCDGDTGTDADIESFFACLAGNCPLPPCASNADFNGDGDVGTDADIEAFFRVLAGGQC